MLAFDQQIRELERTGHRRLVVLSGEAQWTLSQATDLRNALPGDWLWLDDNPSKTLSGLLGREYLHAVFDARAGFDVSAFAALSGTLRAGSLWCCWFLCLLTGPTGQTAILCAGATARSRSPLHTLCTTSAGRLPPIRMRLSGNSIVLCPFPLRRIYPPGSLPAAHRSASRRRSSTRF